MCKGLFCWPAQPVCHQLSCGRPHRARARARGRAIIFTDYRLRVASVLRDYGLNERAEAPADSKALHDEGGVTW